MRWYTKVKYDCRHTTYFIEKKLNGRLGLWSAVKMYVHLITCPFCRLYKRQTKAITQLLRTLYNNNEPAPLDAIYKERLQQMIEERF